MIPEVQVALGDVGTLTLRVSGLLAELGHAASVFRAALLSNDRDYISCLCPLVLQPDQENAVAMARRASSSSRAAAQSGAAVGGDSPAAGGGAEARRARVVSLDPDFSPLVGHRGGILAMGLGTGAPVMPTFNVVSTGQGSAGLPVRMQQALGVPVAASGVRFAAACFASSPHQVLVCQDY
jgi:hypothetical protein